LATSSVLVPTTATLRKYGLSVDDWRTILERQGGVCGSCGRVPPSRRLNIDHQHVRGWKHMDPAIRATYVRGLLCYRCNSTFLSRGATVELLRGAADYLERYQKR